MTNNIARPRTAKPQHGRGDLFGSTCATDWNVLCDLVVSMLVPVNDIAGYPVAPPQRLVVVGFYRYVRNPMYVGFAAGWIGLWVILGHGNPVLITAVAAVAIGVHLFVVFYEEPTLRKKFGADYKEYSRNVRRWWPRARGWDKPQGVNRSDKITKLLWCGIFDVGSG